MNRRVLGRSGIEVSELSFGTVSLGIPYGIGVEGEESMPTETEAIRLLRDALDRGINLFDTARGYGCSEDRIGKAFADRRERAVISTKCAGLYDDAGGLPDAKTLRSTMENSLRASLEALQSNYVDVFMLHNGSLDVLESKPVADTMTRFREEKSARAIGVSTYSVEETRTAIQSGVWDVVQLPYNLMDQQHRAAFGLAAERGVGLVVRSVLFKGILTDRGRNLHPALRDVEEHRNRYNELLQDGSAGLADLATRFVLSHPEVASVLVGIDKPEYLEQALAVADGRYLDEAALARAHALEYPEVEFLDLRTWDRKGWLT